MQDISSIYWGPGSMASLPTTIFEDLRSAILGGHLRPGALLTESALAREYGVSKTPVRESLQRLVHIGLVDAIVGRGYSVHQPTVREVRELFAVREILEAESARLAALHVTADEVATMLHLAQVGYEKGNEASVLRFHDANLQLHLLIAKASGNAYLAGLIRQLLQSIQLIVIGEVNFGDPDQIVSEHVLTCEAIARGDAAEAERLTRISVRNGLQRFTGQAGAVTDVAHGGA